MLANDALECQRLRNALVSMQQRANTAEARVCELEARVAELEGINETLDQELQDRNIGRP